MLEDLRAVAAVLGIGFVVLGWLAVRSGHRGAGHTRRQAGLQAIGGSAVLGVGACTWHIVVVSALATAGPRLFLPFAYTAAAAGLLVGVTLISVDSALTEYIRGHRYRRTARDLEPLWSCLVTACPEVILPHARPTTAKRRLFLRVIEIRAGIECLSLLNNAEIEGRADHHRHGLPGFQVPAVSDAAWIAAATLDRPRPQLCDIGTYWTSSRIGRALGLDSDFLLSEAGRLRQVSLALPEHKARR